MTWMPPSSRHSSRLTLLHTHLHQDRLLRLNRSRDPQSVLQDPARSGHISYHGGQTYNASATKITGHDKVIQLLECCDEPLRKDLTRSAGGSLTDKTVDDVLAAIKKLAVREENTMVARVTLHNMRQDREETARSYGARLSGQAGICKFVIKCPGCDGDVNYTDAILRDVLTRVIADTGIQLDMLGDTKQDMSLEEVFQFVEAKEAGKRSASRLLDSHPVEAASSTYRKQKTDNQH
jgi:hypothetical protein